MSYQKMTLAERMDIFQLFYVEKLKPAKIAALLHRKTSSITREPAKGTDNGFYNPVIAEVRHLEAGKNQRPRLKMAAAAWGAAKQQLEKRRSPEAVEQWLKKEYPEHAMSGKTIYN
jgi:IS30 family transposase